MAPPAAPSPAPTTPAMSPGFATRHTRSPVDGEHPAAGRGAAEAERMTAGVTVAGRIGRGAAATGDGAVATRVTRGWGTTAGATLESAKRSVFVGPTAASLDAAAGLMR